MDGRDERLDPVRSFALISFRLDPETWQDFVMDEENQVIISGFFSAHDSGNLFICRRRSAAVTGACVKSDEVDSEPATEPSTETPTEPSTTEPQSKPSEPGSTTEPDAHPAKEPGDGSEPGKDPEPGPVPAPDHGLCVSLTFPHDVQGKVICVSKIKDSASLSIQEVYREQITDYIIDTAEQVTCPLLLNMGGCWAVGVAEEALRFMQRQKNEAQVMKEQIEGRTFLPQPARITEDGLHDDKPQQEQLQDTEKEEEGVRKSCDVKLLQACDWTVIEWAELVSEFLQQDSSQPLLDGLKPLPSQEFSFWKCRLRNLLFIQEQLRSSRAQQVASIVQQADSVYWSTLTEIYTNVQEGLKEAEDVTKNLTPLEEKLLQLEKMKYKELGSCLPAVMQEVVQVWLRSEFYCRASRMVVLLQEICNLFIHMSREFLRGDVVMAALLREPAPVLRDVQLVIRTLLSLKEAYSHSRTALEEQSQEQGKQGWDFPSYLIFIHLDNFLTRLHSIQDVLGVSLQLSQLEHTVVSGVKGRIWTDVIQEVHHDFLSHVRVLAECGCDPTEPTDQGFQECLDQFQLQVCDLERRLVSVLSRAFEDCCVSSAAARLVKMFWFLLERPVIRAQLMVHLDRLVQMVLEELDHTDALFQSQRDEPGGDRAAAALCSITQLQQRADRALRSYSTVQHIYVDSGETAQVNQRFKQISEQLQSFRETLKADWSIRLDQDCAFILKQPLIHTTDTDRLGLSCPTKLEAALKQLRCLSREPDVELGSAAGQMFSQRHEVTACYLSLGHMLQCYNQVLDEVLPVELPLIQDQLTDLNHKLLTLKSHTWGGKGVQQHVEQQRSSILSFCSTVREARANMDSMTAIIQRVSELHLLHRPADSLLEGRATESYQPITEQGEELHRLTEANRTLLGAELSDSHWIQYLAHLDSKVEEGLFQLLLRALKYLTLNMSKKSPSALFCVRLRLEETGSVFEPSVGLGLSDIITDIIKDVYAAAALIQRVNHTHTDSYQVSLQKRPELLSLEQGVLQALRSASEAAGSLQRGLDRFSTLWQSDRQSVMEDFLLYSRPLGADELEADSNPPGLKDFKKEIELLQKLSLEVSQLDDVTLCGWLQVDLQPIRDSLLSLISDWTGMYTEYLLGSVKESLHKVTQRSDEDEDVSSSSFPLTESILLLEASGVQLPEHMAAQLQC